MGGKNERRDKRKDVHFNLQTRALRILKIECYSWPIFLTFKWPKKMQTWILAKHSHVWKGESKPNLAWNLTIIGKGKEWWMLNRFVRGCVCWTGALLEVTLKNFHGTWIIAILNCEKKWNLVCDVHLITEVKLKQISQTVWFGSSDIIYFNHFFFSFSCTVFAITPFKNPQKKECFSEELHGISRTQQMKLWNENCTHPA